MKRSLWKLCLLAGIVWISALGEPAKVGAAEDNSPGPGDRLQRLERRLNEMADRQEQMMRRMGAPDERQGRPMPEMRGPQDRSMPGVPPNFHNARGPWAAAGMPAPMMARPHKGLRCLLGCLLLAGIVINILLATWIYTDIRKRGEGSGIFIALALVAGIPAAIIYALVRIGDKKT